jgi:hypothetical protein
MRAGTAIMTGGMNLLLTPNKRGDIYLNIVTDTNAYMLRQAPPTELGIKCAHRLAAAGQGVLQRAAAQHKSDGLKASPRSSLLAARLEELQKLRDSAMLSDDEYQSLRAKALQDL